MSCSPFDLRDYILRELPDPQQRSVESHLKTCQPCREELERLSFTEAALLSVRDEEIPQRIAFVSDKIFEPSPWGRWWASFWGSAARLGFASAAMLSAAIVLYALHPAKTAPAAPPPTQQIVLQKTISDSDIQARIDAAVTKAVAAVEARQSEKTERLVADLESARRGMKLAAAEFDMTARRYNNQRVLSAGYSLPPDPDAKEPK